MSEYNELSQFSGAFTPAAAMRPGLDSLADGEYDFEITAAELTRTPKDNELIFRFSLRVISTGQTVEKVYFFRSQQNVDFLGADLCALGIDADQWKPPARPLEKELPAALPKLRGVRFRGKKVTAANSKDHAKPFHNLYINNRLAAGAMPAPALSPAPVPF